jgi:hypothetical protein
VVERLFVRVVERAVERRDFRQQHQCSTIIAPLSAPFQAPSPLSGGLGRHAEHLAGLLVAHEYEELAGGRGGDLSGLQGV